MRIISPLIFVERDLVASSNTSQHRQTASKNIFRYFMIIVMGMAVTFSVAYILYQAKTRSFDTQEAALVHAKAKAFESDIVFLADRINEIDAFYLSSSFVDEGEFQMFVSHLSSFVDHSNIYGWIAAEEFETQSATYIYPPQYIDLDQYIEKSMLNLFLSNHHDHDDLGLSQLDSHFYSRFTIINDVPYLVFARFVEKSDGEEMAHILGLLFNIVPLNNLQSFSDMELNGISLNVKPPLDPAITLLQHPQDLKHIPDNSVVLKEYVKIYDQRYVLNLDKDKSDHRISAYDQSLFAILLGSLITAFMVIYMVLLSKRYAVAEGILDEIDALGTRESRQHGAKFPHDLLIGTFIVFLGSTAWLSYQVYNQYGSFSDTLDSIIEAKVLASDITLYDEILTGSAQLGAARGDMKFLDRYDAYEPVLLETLETAGKTFPNTSLFLGANKIAEANGRLVEMEVEAFDYISSSQPHAAQNLLFGDEYKALKKTYGEGIKQFQIAVEEEKSQKLKSLRMVMSFNLVFALFICAVGLILFYVIYSILKKWAVSLVYMKERAQEEVIAKQDAVKDAEKANHAKSEFLANMSHELRTPLNSIVGMVQLLKTRKLENEVRESFDMIEASSAALLEIVNDILDLSKIEAGQINLENRAFDGMQKIRHTVEAMKPLARQKRLSLRLDSELDKLYVIGDELRFMRILTNLLSNAVRYTNEGSITVNVFVKGTPNGLTNIRCEVVDTGVGIATDKTKKVFEKFMQADTSTTRKFGGTGLGLAITKQLVELMDGQIGVDSEEGVGSTFWFDIPFETVDEIEAKKDIVAAIDHSTDDTKTTDEVRILVAEDHMMNQAFMKKLFASFNISNYKIVENGEEAVQAVDEGDYDLVLMDCHMPVMSGYEATSAIRELFDPVKNTIPIIAMTANAMPEDEEKCLAIGMNAYISKPVNLDVFKEKTSPWIKFVSSENT